MIYVDEEEINPDIGWSKVERHKKGREGRLQVRAADGGEGAVITGAQALVALCGEAGGLLQCHLLHFEIAKVAASLSKK